MEICHCMALVKDQTVSLAFERVAVAEHVTVGMDAVVKSLIDVEGDLYLYKDTGHVEGMASDMETQKVVDSEQLTCTCTDNKAPEEELAEHGEFPILH